MLASDPLVGPTDYASALAVIIHTLIIFIILFITTSTDFFGVTSLSKIGDFGDKLTLYEFASLIALFSYQLYHLVTVVSTIYWLVTVM